VRPNFFVGFPLTDSWVPRAIAGIPPGLRTFYGEDVHITIAFLGPCGDEAAWAAWQVFAGDHPAALFRNEPAIALELGAIEPFGPPSLPSALSVIPTDPHGPVTVFLARYRDAILAAAGLPAEQRLPRPHATIARFPRNAKPAQREAGLRWAAAAPPLLERVTVREVALYTWTEDRSQMLYRIVARRALRESPTWD
jgi:2'-5' RNA ligase